MFWFFFFFKSAAFSAASAGGGKLLAAVALFKYFTSLQRSPKEFKSAGKMLPPLHSFLFSSRVWLGNRKYCHCMAKLRLEH